MHPTNNLPSVRLGGQCGADPWLDTPVAFVAANDQSLLEPATESPADLRIVAGFGRANQAEPLKRSAAKIVPVVRRRTRTGPLPTR
jgi:hypothetical protein